MNKRLVASLLTALLIIQSTAYAAANTESNAAATANVQTVEEQTDAVDEETGLPILTLEEAIEKGMKNSLLYQLVENKSDIASLVNDNASTVRNDLANAEDDINDAIYKLDSGRDKVNEGAKVLEYFNNGEFPIQVTCGTILALVKDKPEAAAEFKKLMAAVGYTEGSVLAEPGDSISEFCNGKTKDPIKKVVGTELAGMGYGEDYIKEELGKQMEQVSTSLAAGQEQLASGTQDYIAGQAEYQASLKYALSSVSNKLSTSTISSLEARPLGDLIVKMSAKQDEVYKYSKNIYKNQVALLVANSYFDALKQQELLKVKQKAEERGRVQYEMAQAAFEVGMKSKDDMNIAKTYYDSTIMNTELQLKEYNTALITLKKNMNVSYKDEFVLEAVEPDTSDEFNLETGVKEGLNTRLEIKMAKANQDLYGYLMTAVNDSAYSSSSNQYKEVKLLQEQANIAYDSAQATVESDIRTSYQAVQSTKKLVETAKDLRANAETTVENAKAKYEAGYGYSNSLLASLNLGQLSGTMVEVLAAEENLETIEEKQVEAMNGYNLARLKYLNDIGELPYK